MDGLVRFLMILNFCVAIFTKSTITTTATDVVFLIVSQNNSYHSQLARQLKTDIIRQTRIPPHYVVDVHILHEFSQNPSDWTLTSMLSQLTRTPSNGPGNSFNTDHSNIFIRNSTKWIILCEEHTHVTLIPLLQQLAKLNHTEPLFLGHPLYDNEPTIIHHFTFFENPRCFPYPMLRSGLIFTYALLQRIAEVYTHITHKKIDKDFNEHQNNHRNKKSNMKKSYRDCGQTQRLRIEFSIDSAHELALFIYENLEANISADSLTLNPATKDICKNEKNSTESQLEDRQSKAALMPDHYDDNIDVVEKDENDNKAVRTHMNKIILQRAPFICGMATMHNSNKGTKQRTVGSTSNGKHGISQGATCVMHAKSLVTCPAINREEIYFAIKTCKKFHNERLPIIEATWAPFVKHKRYFSDTEDKLIPTTNVNLSNVASGHCAKTLEILRLALSDIETWNNELTRLKDSRPINWLFLADDDTLLSVANVCEVIGCFVREKDVYLGERYGYRMHAPDGFNYITGGGGIVFSLSVVRLALHHCTCPSDSAPDDMILGACLQALQIKAIHSSRFHQARPNDYAPEYLLLDPPVSFHKFSQLDPVAIYQQWLATADDKLFKQQKRVELTGENLIKFTRTRGNYKRSMSMPHVAKLLHLEKLHLDL